MLIAAALVLALILPLLALMPDVGWPEPAIALGRIESTRSCCPSSRQRSLVVMGVT